MKVIDDPTLAKDWTRRVPVIIVVIVRRDRRTLIICSCAFPPSGHIAALLVARNYGCPLHFVASHFRRVIYEGINGRAIEIETSSGDEHACESAPQYTVVGYTCQWTESAGQLRSTQHRRSFTVPAPYSGPTRLGVVIVSSVPAFSRTHIRRSYDGDVACIAGPFRPTTSLPLPPGPTCVLLLFHAVGDARSAIAFGSSRPFQATEELRFNLTQHFFEIHIRYLLVYNTRRDDIDLLRTVCSRSQEKNSVYVSHIARSVILFPRQRPMG